MNILLLTSSCTAEEEDMLLKTSKCGLQNSIIAFQRNILKGFSECKDVDSLTVINYYPIGCFPFSNRKLVFKSLSYNINNAVIKNIGFLNIQLIKQLIIGYKIKKYIKKWINIHPTDSFILQYDMLSEALKAQVLIQDSGIITSTIVADLPNEFGYKKNENWIKSKIKEHRGRQNLKRLRSLSCYGLLTKQMAEVLNIKEGDYIVVEGFVNPQRYFCPIDDSDDSNEKIVLYTGSLFKIYGLELLLKSFSFIPNKNYKLLFCGVGDGVELINQYSSVDSRIKYLGFRTQEEIARLQSKATVLINPRQNDGDYTKYSFPSKILEYMSTARPVIAYKLDGIPDCYYDYILVPKDNKAESLAEKILEICELSNQERRNIGNKNREFVINRNSCDKVCERLVNLMKKHINQ